MWQAYFYCLLKMTVYYIHFLNHLIVKYKLPVSTIIRGVFRQLANRGYDLTPPPQKKEVVMIFFSSLNFKIHRKCMDFFFKKKLNKKNIINFVQSHP